MTFWDCTYEVRKSSAIGSFFPMTHTVFDASSVRDAMRMAFDWFHENGYETRNPISCNGLERAALAKAMRPEHFSDEGVDEMTKGIPPNTGGDAITA